MPKRLSPPPKVYSIFSSYQLMSKRPNSVSFKMSEFASVFSRRRRLSSAASDARFPMGPGT